MEPGQATDGAASPQVLVLQVDDDDAQHRRPEHEPHRADEEGQVTT